LQKRRVSLRLAKKKSLFLTGKKERKEQTLSLTGKERKKENERNFSLC
jgi:hypothetical protein